MFQSLKNRRQPSEELTDELLSAYLDGQLSLDDRATLEARLRREQALVTRLEGLRQTKRALAHLPQVEVPRNFILAPSMVTPPRRAAAPRRRRTWPVFAWATAIATLLLLVVFAGDLFVYTPSVRREPSDVVAQQPEFLGQAAGENGVERPSAPADVAADEAAAPAEAKAVEVEVPVEGTAEAETAGQEPVVTEVVELEQEVVLEPEGVAEGMVPPATGDVEEAPIEETQILNEEARATGEIETPSFQAAPAPGVAVTTTAAAEAGTESELDTQALREGAVEATPDAVAGVPEELPPPVAGPGKGADDATLWLRLAEIGLGLAIFALATTTFILRRRQV